MIADRERRIKYKKQEEARESVRQNLRDKVIFTQDCDTSLLFCAPATAPVILFETGKMSN